MTTDAMEFQEYLAGLDYPVSKEDLVRHAQETGAGLEILQTLRSVPVEQFASPTEVANAIGEAAP